MFGCGVSAMVLVGFDKLCDSMAFSFGEELAYSRGSISSSSEMTDPAAW